MERPNAMVTVLARKVLVFVLHNGMGRCVMWVSLILFTALRGYSLFAVAQQPVNVSVGDNQQPSVVISPILSEGISFGVVVDRIEERDPTNTIVNLLQTSKQPFNQTSKEVDGENTKWTYVAFFPNFVTVTVNVSFLLFQSLFLLILRRYGS